MHDDEPPEQPIQPPQPKGRRGAGTAGGILVALGLAAAKFKTLLALLFSFKWLYLAPKLLLSVGSMFLSVLVYASFIGGWQIAVIFVAMITVHELGHYVTWRNFGVKANLPMFIPGLGAFTSAPATGTPAQNVAAALAGPAYGIAAAAVCWAYGYETGQKLWLACAYIGFLVNFFNLVPLPPFDGGAAAAAIDARLWFVGIPLFIAWMVYYGASGFTVIFVLLVAVAAFPRLRALWRGELDPRASGLTTPQRILTGGAYFALALIAMAGAAATHLERATA
ncbi:MAG: hypothetical protein JO225_08780 [Candidatus Eremiobacteraeota bacterium]|nr:hypothetical protein [Candidatus Eremiobacteraeota bacterium]